MAWKEWPYWVKGGILGYVIGMILSLFIHSPLFVGGKDPVYYLYALLVIPLRALMTWGFIVIPAGIVVGLIVGRLKQGNAMSSYWFRWGIYFVVISALVNIVALFLLLGGESVLEKIGISDYRSPLMYALIIVAFVFSPGMILTAVDLGMRGSPASVIKTISSWLTGSAVSLSIAFGIGAILGLIIGKIKSRSR